MTGKEKEYIRIGVDLKGENAHRFKVIKEHLGIGNNADVVRWLINWYYNRLQSRSE